jgi:hypothetical protein
VAERYASLDDYTAKVAHALGKMIHQRLLLCEDYDAELNRLVALGSSFGLTPDTSGHAPKVPAPPEECSKKAK